VQPARLVLRDHPEPRELLVHKVPKAALVSLEQRVQLDLRVLLESLAQQDLKVRKVHRESLGLRVQPDPKDPRESLVQPVLKVLRVLPE
jgi:hypothetical protein